MKKLNSINNCGQLAKPKKFLIQVSNFFVETFKFLINATKCFGRPKNLTSWLFFETEICFFETFRDYLVYRELNETFFGIYEK